MEGIKKFTVENAELITWLGLILGVVGIILAVIFYYRAKARKELKYYTYGFNLVHESLSEVPNLQVKFADKEIKNLTVTNLVIWNSGNMTIDKNDHVTLEPIRIVCDEEIVIYSLELEISVEPSNNIQITEHDKSYHCTFDYLDRNQGCIIKIFHSGKNMEPIRLIGKIKGGTISFQTSIDDLSKSMNDIDRILTKLLGQHSPINIYRIIWFFYLVASILLLIGSFYKNDYRIFIGAVFCGLASRLLYPKEALPKSIKKLLEEK